MILIADSGSTKTDWVLLNKKNHEVIFEKTTIGLNPIFLSEEKIKECILKEIVPLVNNTIHSIYFYGAGCLKHEKKYIVKNALQTAFSESKINVYSDLMAVARAVTNSQNGIIGILGTGSAICLYNNDEISNTSSGYGYVYGDEGSGAHIGKLFIADFLNDFLPLEISELFQKEFGLSKSDIIHKTYKEERPNYFLASFNPFINNNINHSHLYNLVYNALDLCFKYYISQYDKKYSLYFVGSIAYVYKDILKKISIKYDYELKNVIKKPMNNLITWHFNN